MAGAAPQQTNNNQTKGEPLSRSYYKNVVCSIINLIGGSFDLSFLSNKDHCTTLVTILEVKLNPSLNKFKSTNRLNFYQINQDTVPEEIIVS